MAFSRSSEDFQNILEELCAANPDGWARKDVPQCLFLMPIWMLMENPSDSSFTLEKTARERTWSEGLKGRSLLNLDGRPSWNFIANWRGK